MLLRLLPRLTRVPLARLAPAQPTRRTSQSRSRCLTTSNHGNRKSHATFGKVLVQSAVLFETLEQIYERILRLLKPHPPLPLIEVHYRPYANANSRIRLSDGRLLVEISDLLQNAPAPVQEALAHILLAKLFRRRPDRNHLALYRRYLNRADVI